MAKRRRDELIGELLKVMTVLNLFGLPSPYIPLSTLQIYRYRYTHMTWDSVDG